MTRTHQQQKALEVYCQQLAEKMTDAGYTQRETMAKFKEGFDIHWTKSAVKDVFREIGRIMFDKKSTADLDTKEVNEVYRIVDLRFNEITGCSCEFPSIDSMREKARDNE